MNEEEFYATIKLVSGEEIFAKVCPFDEEDKTILVLDNPIMIETIYVPRFEGSIVKVHPWIKLSDDTMFIINLDKVITMTEVFESSLIKIHKKYSRERFKSSNKSEITPNMGFVSSINDARRSLEKIYNLKSFKSNLDNIKE
jgi:hypothetical protein